jgi:uncharacterized protein (TIGR00255 family)
MIRSMTGYGASGAEADGLRAAVTVRSLNHRFLELNLRVSRSLQPLEAEIKEVVQSQVRRGRVDLSVEASFPEAMPSAVVASKPLVEGLVATLRQLQAEHGLRGDVTVSDVARFPGALEAVETRTAIGEARQRRILDLVQEAVDGLLAMRQAEGGSLQPVLERAFSAILEAASRIEALAALSREARQAQLLEKLRGLCVELGLEDARLYQEVVRAVERHDVSEELQRLRSHVALGEGLLRGEEPAGKRLDFVAQELLREANTVGSKAWGSELAHEVIALKAEIEKLREQVQNVE